MAYKISGTSLIKVMPTEHDRIYAREKENALMRYEDLSLLDLIADLKLAQLMYRIYGPKHSIVASYEVLYKLIQEKKGK